MLHSSTGPVVARRRDSRDPAEAKAFADHIVGLNLLDRLSADRALQAQLQTRERIDVVVVQLGILSEADLSAALASYFGQPLMSPSDVPTTPLLSEHLDPAFLKRARIVPLQATADELVLATADPFAMDTLAAAGFACGRAVTVRVASPTDIEAALSRLYPEAVAVGAAEEATGTVVGIGEHHHDVQRLKDLASAAPVIRLVHDLIQSAVEARASDIHIEPLIDCVRVRFRIDGVMAEVQRLAPDLQAAIISRIKIMARLDVAERRLPQDGRTSIVFRGREIDLRVATAPLLGGESVVLRLLDRATVPLSLSALGFDADLAAKLSSLIALPNGIVLVTGPTGSGKTTTLYAGLSMLNGTERKIFTVEDPIEYQLPGVNQMQVKPALELTFASGLRAILRQDPDVVMVGEMRDTDTARTGIQAALTGHLVLSTLHTNSAAASVTRLLDMGVEDYLLASTLAGIVAQRLVRTLCDACAQADPEGHEQLRAHLGTATERLDVLNVKKPCGCAACRGTGYLGRTTIAEIMVFDASLRGLVRRGVLDQELDRAARTAGMQSLFEHGLRKVAGGQTTLAEVLKVARS